MSHTLIFATHNKHKLSEVKALLPDWVDLKSLDDINMNDPIPETGDTLSKNALNKAYYVFSRTKEDCFAEDTGLEVDALQGAPGVYSARYAGEPANDQNNIDLLLKNMTGQQDRKARFRTVFCLIYNGKKWNFEGTVEGAILQERHGSGGFGYDAVFQPDGYDRSFAEMSQEEKSRISHRGRALTKMLEFLKDRETGTTMKAWGEFA